MFLSREEEKGLIVKDPSLIKAWTCLIFSTFSEITDPPLIFYQYKKPIRNIIFNYNRVTSDPDFRNSIQSSCSCADSPCLYPPAHHVVTGDLPVFLTKDYGHFLRKGPNTDFHPGLILLNAGVLSRKHFRLTVNDGARRKASECMRMPLTTGKMNFYTPVFWRDVLWYGDVHPTLHPSVRPTLRPGLRPPVFRTFLIHALTYWAEILHMTLF